jgi:hypothetical protein
MDDTIYAESMKHTEVGEESHRMNGTISTFSHLKSKKREGKRMSKIDYHRNSQSLLTLAQCELAVPGIEDFKL